MAEISLGTWLSILGIPSIFSIVVYLIKMVAASNKERKEHESLQDRNMGLLMKAFQEQMKDRLMQSYRYHMEKKWISDVEFQCWESQYNAYHDLGNNGFMTDKYHDLEVLPRHKPVSNRKKTSSTTK